MEKFTLTAADHGIAAAAYDDAKNAGLGDDDTADMIFWALVANNRPARITEIEFQGSKLSAFVADYEQPLYKFAYGLIASKK